MPLISRLIWPIDTPKIAGPISFSTRHTPGSCRFRRGRGSSFRRAR